MDAKKASAEDLLDALSADCPNPDQLFRLLVRMARRSGVEVAKTVIDEPADHEGKYLLGYYSHSRNVIVLDQRLGTRQRLAVMAHELGHALLGHTDSSPLSEAEADSFAAGLVMRHTLNNP